MGFFNLHVIFTFHHSYWSSWISSWNPFTLIYWTHPFINLERFIITKKHSTNHAKPMQIKGYKFFCFFLIIGWYPIPHCGTLPLFWNGSTQERLQPWMTKSFCVPAKYLKKHKNNLLSSWAHLSRRFTVTNRAGERSRRMLSARCFFFSPEKGALQAAQKLAGP